MAGGHENLRPKPFTTERAREEGRKGGIASGIARRRKANLKKALQALLTAKGPTIDGEEVTYEEALALAMVEEALGGGKNNVAAFNAIRQTLSLDEEAAERKARIQKLRAETEEIKRRAQADEEAAGAPVVIVDDIPDAPEAGPTQTAVFDALGESSREAGSSDGTGTGQAD